MEELKMQIISAEKAQLAVQFLTPLVDALFSQGITKRRVLCVAVALSDGSFFEHQFGDLPREQWSNDYQLLAKDKAMLSNRTGLSTREIVTSKPALLHEGAVLYGGGVHMDGISVGASGVEWYYDEMFATMLASVIRALTHKYVEFALKQGHYA
ncbi:MAG TPA: hypothetical protein VGQ87_01880 [Patescibacteria group bacterium]|jgi:hypothetical protein|nr:hypothetical protein [Patescibacteria group bacterium]